MPRLHSGARLKILTIDCCAVVTRCVTAGGRSFGGGGTATMLVEGRSPKTGGKPLWSRNPRSEEYRCRKLSGTSPFTHRTMVEWLAWRARLGYGERASGTATIQATSSTE